MSDGLVARGADLPEHNGALVRRVLALEDADAARQDVNAPNQGTARWATGGNDTFLSRLITAAEDVLDNWSLSILNARYGLYTHRSMTTEEIAAAAGLSAALVNAHIESALRRISEQGHRELASGDHTQPCAHLLSYVRARVQPDNPEATGRLVAFACRELPHLGIDFDLTVLPSFFLTSPEPTPFRAILARLELIQWLIEGSEQGRHSLSWHGEYGPDEQREFEALLTGVEWPSETMRYRRWFGERPVPDETTANGLPLCIHFPSQKMGQGFAFRNATEFRMLLHLECNEAVREYRERPARIAMEAPAGGEETFLEGHWGALLNDGRVILIYLVPPGQVVGHLHSPSVQALRDHCSQQGYGLLVTDGRDTAHSHRQWPLQDDNDASVLIKRIGASLAGEADIDLSDLPLTHRELCGLVARENLIWKPGTWVVSSPFEDASASAVGLESDQAVEETDISDPPDVQALTFVELMAKAVRETVYERDAAVFLARYGLLDGRARTLAEVGNEFGLSRERVRQIVMRCFPKIKRAALVAQRRGRHDAPAAQLVDTIQRAAEPNKEGAAERLLAFMRTELAHLRSFSVTESVMLVAWLVCSKEAAQRYARQVKDLVAEETRARREQQRDERRSHRLEGLLQDVIWPPATTTVTPKEFGQCASARTIATETGARHGCIESAKLGRDVAYESLTERAFLELLEDAQQVVFYQEQPFRVPYEAQGRLHHTYPDVFLVLADGRGVVVEVAPPFEMAAKENWSKWHGLRAFCRERGYGLLITDGRRTFQSVSRSEVRPEVRESLLAALDEGPMDWTAYRAWRETSGITVGELCAIIIRERLTWQLRPFWLARE